MRLLSSAVCAIGAAVCAAVSAHAAETIAYWPFGTNGFHDVSGNGHDFVGVEVASSDAAYMALNQGTTTNQYLKTAAPIDLSGESAVTIECWCRQTGRPDKTYGVLFSTPSPTVGTGGIILYSVGIFQAQTRTSDKGWHIDGSYTNSATTVSQALAADYVDGAWHHVAYVIDRSRVNDHYACRLYIDGVLQRNVGTSGGAPYTVPALFNDYFQIGNCPNYVSEKSYFRGYIDDVRISRGVVAPENFLRYPTVGKAMRADDGKLPVVAHWPFGNKAGKDATGNGFDLISSNVFFKSGYAQTTWGTRKTEFACSVNGGFPFSAFSKTGLTIEMFVKSDSSSKVIGMLMETGPAYWNNPGSFRISFDANNAGYTTLFSGYHVSGTNGVYSRTYESSHGGLGDGKWRHLAMVYDPVKQGAGIITMYIDGVPAECSTDASNPDQKAFALGDLPLYLFRRANKQVNAAGDNEGSVCPYYGSLDDVRITAAALTPDKFIPSRSAPKPIALYDFEKETIVDQTGNGHALTFEGGNPVFAYTTSGYCDGCTSLKGLKMSGATRFHTTDAVDLTHTKQLTVEFDYNRDWNPNLNIAMIASADVSLAGGFTFYRNTGNAFQAQFHATANASSWTSILSEGRHDSVNGYFRARYSINGDVYPSAFAVTVDGTNKTGTATATFANLGNQQLYFGGCPTYCADNRFYGYFYRIAITDETLDPADYVLDNLSKQVASETKATLAYWDFFGFADKSGAGNDLIATSGCQRRKGALLLDGTSSASTEDTLYLAGLSQATIECFVCFDETPSSGTIFSLGSGVGSFSVAADATAGTLAGTFIPYDHLAASCGGTTALAPLAGKAKFTSSWHHVALVIDRTKSGADAVKFYVDYERATPAGRAWDSAAAMIDGTLVVGSGFTGYIDDLRVSKGALSPSEFIQASARTFVPDGLMVLLR